MGGGKLDPSRDIVEAIEGEEAATAGLLMDLSKQQALPPPKAAHAHGVSSKLKAAAKPKAPEKDNVLGSKRPISIAKIREAIQASFGDANSVYRLLGGEKMSATVQKMFDKAVTE